MRKRLVLIPKQTRRRELSIYTCSTRADHNTFFSGITVDRTVTVYKWHDGDDDDDDDDGDNDDDG